MAAICLLLTVDMNILPPPLLRNHAPANGTMHPQFRATYDPMCLPTASLARFVSKWVKSHQLVNTTCGDKKTKQNKHLLWMVWRHIREHLADKSFIPPHLFLIKPHGMLTHIGFFLANTYGICYLFLVTGAIQLQRCSPLSPSVSLPLSFPLSPSLLQVQVEGQQKWKLNFDV